MTAPHALRDLATLIEGVDGAGVSVGDVQTPGRTLVDGETVTVTLPARIECASLDALAGDVSVTLPDGTKLPIDGDAATLEIPLQVEIGATGETVEDGPSPETLAEEPGTATDESPTADATPEADPSPDIAKPQVTDGGVALPPESSEANAGTAESETVTVAQDGETEEREVDASDVDRTADDEPTSESASPSYRDPERLREAYEAHETFAEMTEALGASVTPQTVRHHMIKHGIHRPNARIDSESGAETEVADPETESESGRAEVETSDSAGGPRSESDATADTGSTEPAAADASRSSPSDDRLADAVDETDLPPGVDLPTHVTLDELKSAVVKSTTLYEVQRELRIDRSKARGLLRDLDLLDFVGGRITADGRREPMEIVDERIRRACA
ncbi:MULTISPECIES: hypothetical protein [Halorussus]|uniref:hypothetical protein n=1 Tax=Halorussus TaxID=1070314 RepID=UPI00209FB22D|nr:hypothetical protein [Halorussus vallis]USZ77417.1 hypothetical protein NGM07_08805 [Halorussus vallis]